MRKKHGKRRTVTGRKPWKPITGKRLLPGVPGRNIWGIIPQNPFLLTGKACWEHHPARNQPKVFNYKNARTTEQWKECGEELKLRLKENLQAKIAPVAKAYGMKKAGPKTFVREKNGLVSRIQFIGYFRGGGYEAMICYLCPIYAIQYGILGLPGHVSRGDISKDG